MSSEFWGMTAFFITTMGLLIIVSCLKQKIDRLERERNQTSQKASPNQPHDYERQNKK